MRQPSPHPPPGRLSSSRLSDSCPLGENVEFHMFVKCSLHLKGLRQAEVVEVVVVVVGGWWRGEEKAAAEEEEAEEEGVLFISLPHRVFIIEGRRLETDSRSEPPGCESARSGTCNPLQICGNVFLSRKAARIIKGGGGLCLCRSQCRNKNNNRLAK